MKIITVYPNFGKYPNWEIVLGSLNIIEIASDDIGFHIASSDLDRICQNLIKIGTHAFKVSME